MTDDPARALAHRLGNLCGVIRTQAEVVREIDDPAALRRALDIIERAAIGAEDELHAARDQLRRDAAGNGDGPTK